MTRDKKKQLAVHAAADEGRDAVDEHIVFDFSDAHDPDIEDIALILTARLQSAPTDNVWARSVSWRTAQILRYLRLDHLFRHYPTDEGQMN